MDVVEVARMSKRIKDAGRIDKEEVIAAAESLGVSLIVGEYEDCSGGVCPMQAIAKVLGLIDAEDLWFASWGILSEAYSVGYIREYDRIGHEIEQEYSGEEHDRYVQGKEDGKAMREWRDAHVSR